MKIDFDMISVFNTDQELETIFLEHKRGEEAAKKRIRKRAWNVSCSEIDGNQWFFNLYEKTAR